MAIELKKVGEKNAVYFWGGDKLYKRSVIDGEVYWEYFQLHNERFLFLNANGHEQLESAFQVWLKKGGDDG